MISDEATDKMLIAEELRLSNNHAHSKAVRAERERNHMKLERSGQTRILSIPPFINDGFQPWPEI